MTAVVPPSWWYVDPATEQLTRTVASAVEAACESTVNSDVRLVISSDAKHRENIRHRLFDALRKTKRPASTSTSPDAVLSNEDCAAHAKHIENVLFQRFFYDDPGRYAEKCRVLEFNLERNGYYLLTRFGPDTICSFPATKLAENTPEGAWRDEQVDVLLKDVHRRRRSSASEKGIFKCPKCHGYDTTYYSMQTRSADEPMTNFVTCLKCNVRFKR